MSENVPIKVGYLNVGFRVKLLHPHVELSVADRTTLIRVEKEEDAGDALCHVVRRVKHPQHLLHQRVQATVSHILSCAQLQIRSIVHPLVAGLCCDKVLQENGKHDLEGDPNHEDGEQHDVKEHKVVDRLGVLVEKGQVCLPDSEGKREKQGVEGPRKGPKVVRVAGLEKLCAEDAKDAEEDDGHTASVDHWHQRFADGVNKLPQLPDLAGHPEDSKGADVLENVNAWVVECDPVHDPNEGNKDNHGVEIVPGVAEKGPKVVSIEV
mmetsp:Transcript_21912/g.50887  ORF Transcript_21912/g.50887 Transcript_21912/m.50887 type:complete len:266 (-) Transcript_21912:1006-1803(-)